MIIIAIKKAIKLKANAKREVMYMVVKGERSTSNIINKNIINVLSQLKNGRVLKKYEVRMQVNKETENKNICIYLF